MGLRAWLRVGLGVMMGMAVAVGVMTAPAAARVQIPTKTPASTNAGLAPQKYRAEGRTHYYQIPVDPRGTLFVLPGCARWGPGFWPYDKTACPECVGLTEDVAHTKQALARGYAILVGWPVDLANPGQLCWSAKDDGPTVTTILEGFVQKHGLAKKPVYVLGASSGGSVSLRLSAMLVAKKSPLRISGVLAEVSTRMGVDDAVRGLKTFPPIAWISLGTPKEIQAVKDHAALYTKKYGPGAHATALRRPITPSYFSDRHPGISPEKSAALAKAMREVGLVRADGLFAYDFKEKKVWVGQLHAKLPWLKHDPAFASLGSVKHSAIMQAMLLAYGGHEHVCDFLTAALMWFEQGGKPDFAALASRFRVVKPSALTMARQVDGASLPTPAAAFAFGLHAAPKPASPSPRTYACPPPPKLMTCAR